MVQTISNNFKEQFVSNAVRDDLLFSQACGFSPLQAQQQPVTGMAGDRRVTIAPGGLPPDQKQRQMASVSGHSALHTKTITSAVGRSCIDPMQSTPSVPELEEWYTIGGAPTAAYFLYSDPSFVADGPGQSCSIGICTLATFTPSCGWPENQEFQSNRILARNGSGKEIRVSAVDTLKVNQADVEAKVSGVPVKQRTLLLAKDHVREVEASTGSDATEDMEAESWQNQCKKELASVLENARLEKISHIIFTRQLTDLHDNQRQSSIYKSIIREILSDQRIKMQEVDGIGDSSSGFAKIIWVEPVIHMDAREKPVFTDFVTHYLHPHYDYFLHEDTNEKRKAKNKKDKEFCGFFRVNEQWGELSNFWCSTTARLTIDGLEWRSVEHYFQACKFHYQSSGWEKIRAAKKPESAKQVARAAVQNSSADLRFGSEEWDSIKDKVMLKALRAKVESCPEFCETLERSQTCFLYEKSPYDEYWGLGRRRTGENRLGRLLMQVRSEYYAGLLHGSIERVVATGAIPGQLPGNRKRFASEPFY
ncbi:NADAR family protein [Endozoicomonas sp. SCSIO W0465]|uniref:NADAR family protein n=1 Tax=Endozoicomonas sp. SCSIO W0465 TaxID=2918516 RepID=UPI0020761477|nr:NADAR family protein [Endozoicomonas sp. SCSIO W0465]USE37263.1 NADAR family protein [Endozoicomonas sp. SCSIO W0465]